jgi:hypothetical protein
MGALDVPGIVKTQLGNQTDPTQGAAFIGWDNQTIANFFTNYVEKHVASVAELRTVDPTKYNHVFRKGYAAAGDGGQMAYVYVPSGSPPADNGATYVSALGGLGYWLGLFAGEVNLLQFGAIRGSIDKADLPDSADSGPALQAAIAFATATYPTLLRIPAGYYISSYAPGQITEPIRIAGDGWRQTIIQLVSSVTGPFLAPTDVGFAGNATDYITDGNRPITSIQNAKAAFELTDISVYGDRTSTLQEGLIFKGDCDHLCVKNVMLMHLNGRALAAGDASPLTGLRGQIRESEFWNIKTRNCGNPGIWDIDVTMNEQTSNNDSSNIVNFWGIESIFFHGGGLRICDQRTTTAGPNLYVINFHGCTVHGRFATDTYNANEPILIQGNVTGCKIEAYIGYNMADLWSYRQIANPTNSAVPNHNKVLLTYGTIRKGYSIEAGGIDQLEIINPFSYQETGQVATGTQNVSIACEGNQPFLSVPVAVTFNGTNAISIGAGSALPGITTLLPVMSAANGGSGTGDGDTTNVMFYGIQCVLTRTGSVAGNTDTYTLTPVNSSTVAVAAGQFLSKHIVQTSSYPNVRGRFLNTPRAGYGLNAGFYLVDNQAQVKFDLGGGKYAYMTPDSGNNFKLIVPDNASNPYTILNVLGGNGLTGSATPIATWGIAPTFGSYAPSATNLLQISSWRFWIDTTPAVARFRFAGHAPTSLTDGLVIQTSQSSVVGSEPISPSTGEQNFWSDLKIPGYWNGLAWVPSWGYVWTGAWNSATAYTIGQAVVYLGINYVALTSSTNVIPSTHPGNWQILVQNVASTTPIGAAGGDLTGSYPNPTIATVGGYGVPQIVGQSGAVTTITNATSPSAQQLASISLPAVLANGSLEIDMLLSVPNNANTKTFAILIGGTTMYSANLTSNATFRLLVKIQNANSQTSQTVSAPSVTTVGPSSVAVATTTANLTAATTMVLQGTLPTSGDTMTMYSYSVTLKNHT